MNCKEKQTRGSSVVPELPLELITEILVNLPVKSLLQFRLVCKSWRSLISSRQFVKKHLSICTSSTTSTPKRVMFNDNYPSLYDLMFHRVDDSILVHGRRIHTGNKKAEYCIMGSCDGLVCIYYGSTIFICNPSTRDCKRLPHNSQVVDRKVLEAERNYGFGFDCKSDDYKVLVLAIASSPTENQYRYKSMMYTLRTDSWRRIQDSPLDTRFIDKSATFVSGALHWMAVEGSSFTVIVSLDLTSETYMQVPQPADLGTCSSQLAQVGDSRGCLCLLVHNHAADSQTSYDIWVMKEYGVRESWTKSIKIPFVGSFKLITWPIENGEILLGRVGNLLASYNANRNSVRYLYIDGGGLLYRSPGNVVYVESLVSPNAYSGANEFGGFLDRYCTREKNIRDDEWGEDERAASIATQLSNIFALLRLGLNCAPYILCVFLLIKLES